MIISKYKLFFENNIFLKFLEFCLAKIAILREQDFIYFFLLYLYIGQGRNKRHIPNIYMYQILRTIIFLYIFFFLIKKKNIFFYLNKPYFQKKNKEPYQIICMN